MTKAYQCAKFSKKFRPVLLDFRKMPLNYNWWISEACLKKSTSGEGTCIGLCWRVEDNRLAHVMVAYGETQTTETLVARI